MPLKGILYFSAELDKMLTKSCETEDEAKKDKILAPFDECINYIQVCCCCTYNVNCICCCVYYRRTIHFICLLKYIDYIC